MSAIHSIILFGLAAIFATAGFLKLKIPKQKLHKSLPWTRDFKPATIKFIGFSEFSAALGLAGPKIIGFGYSLNSYAALGISLIMILAGIYHSRKKEYLALTINLIFFILCLLILFGFNIA